MNRSEYLRLMQFPAEWEQLGLVPDEWLEGALGSYKKGHEDGSEHDRHGAFQWWLRRSPSKGILLKLAALSWLDPDQPMAGYVRECISQSSACDAEVANALRGTQ